MNRIDADSEPKDENEISSVGPAARVDRSGSDRSGSESIRGDLLNLLRGCCMGAADAVPGIRRDWENPGGREFLKTKGPRDTPIFIG